MIWHSQALPKELMRERASEKESKKKLLKTPPPPTTTDRPNDSVRSYDDD